MSVTNSIHKRISELNVDLKLCIQLVQSHQTSLDEMRGAIKKIDKDVNGLKSESHFKKKVFKFIVENGWKILLYLALSVAIFDSAVIQEILKLKP